MNKSKYELEVRISNGTRSGAPRKGINHSLEGEKCDTKSIEPTGMTDGPSAGLHVKVVIAVIVNP